MNGTCEVCKRADIYVQRDRRIPGQFGGTYDARNVHPMCHDCHKRKSALEFMARVEPMDAATFVKWFDLAYPQPTPPAALEYNAEWRGASAEDERIEAQDAVIYKFTCDLYGWPAEVRS